MEFTTLAYILAAPVTALIFSRRLHAAYLRARAATARATAVRLLVRRAYYDTNTGARFEAWRPVDGLRLRLVRLLVG